MCFTIKELPAARLLPLESDEFCDGDSAKFGEIFGVVDYLLRSNVLIMMRLASSILLAPSARYIGTKPASFFLLLTRLFLRHNFVGLRVYVSGTSWPLLRSKSFTSIDILFTRRKPSLIFSQLCFVVEASSVVWLDILLNLRMCCLSKLDLGELVSF